MTVTELLRGERLGGNSLDADEVETLVSRVVELSAQTEGGREKSRFWRLAWAASAALAALELAVLKVLDVPLSLILSGVLLVEGLMLGFGFYFCFFAKTAIPAFYDENRLNFYSDGPFRMNLPGVRFSNRNWPHIVKAARVWMLAVAAAFPALYAAAWFLLPAALWREGAALFLQLAAALGFFVPMVTAAKKYE